MGTEVPITAPLSNSTGTKDDNGRLEWDEDMPLAQRLLLLQKKRAAELANKPKTDKEKTKDDIIKSTKQTNKTVTNGNAKTTQEDEKAPVKIKKDPATPVIKKDSVTPTIKKDSATPTIKKDPGTPVVIKKDPGMPIKRNKINPIKDEEDQRKTSKKIKKDPGLKGTGGETTDAEGNEEYRWWEQENDGTVKWTTLQHNGVYFSPIYQPHGVKMHYDGVEISLEPEAEEVASFFAAIIGTDHYENEIFKKNFFEDFQATLHQIDSKYRHIIKEFEKCDFTAINEYLALQREQRKVLSKEEKEKIKVEKAEIENFFGFCLLDGRREKVGNFKMEPAGLFRGRGKHPRAGKLKHRVVPEQVTINIGADATIPKPPEGHQWGKVVHDNTVTWLATWIENINKQQKYVFLAAGSSLKGQSDLKKFEIARKLHKHVKHIRKVNAEELRSKEMLVRQRATALWLIDRLALRAGNEKGDDEADTVGCCSLRCEHIRLQEPNIVIFDFLGKDSIRYYNEVPVDGIIFKNLSIFMRPPKQSSDPIFDRLNTSGLNKYLNGLMPGLTAKVFRTYNASHTFQVELDKVSNEGTIHELVLSYNRANRQVAILCNHQKSVPKTHQQSMEKLGEKILTMKYQRHLVRKELLEVVGKKELKQELPKALEPEPDMDASTIKRKANEEIAAKAEKAASKDAGDGDESSSPTKKSRTKQASKESLIKKFNGLTSRIDAANNQRIDRDENKTTALGTSKTNYIDPRITAAWCQKFSVPVDKMFSKTLREKFKWAMTVEADWRF